MNVNVLYISYNGINEPLVESQVLAYLKALSLKGVRYTLITFERSALEAGSIEAKKIALLAHNIEWHPVVSSFRFGAISAVIDVYKGYKLARGHVVNADIIHARAFIPALIGRLLKCKQNVLLLNDMRGFWVDEKVYKNSIKANGLIFRIAKRLEGWVLKGSDYIVSLTDAGQRELSTFHCFKTQILPPMITIPTCVDTQKFSQKTGLESTALVLGYVGSMSSDYLPNEVFKFYSVFKEHHSACVLKLISKSDHHKVRAMAARFGLRPNDYVLVSALPKDVPKHVKTFNLALSFIKPGFAKMASCPTKVGEYLASGVPVICNAGIGDIDSVIDGSGAGVLLPSFSNAALVQRMEEMDTLMYSSNTPNICRALAESYFSLEKGVAKYYAVYGHLSKHNKKHRSEGVQ